VDRTAVVSWLMTSQRLIEEKLTSSAIGAFFEVHNTLGFGFLEHVYVRALEIELRRLGHRVGRQVGVQIMYKGEEIAYQRLDLIVNDKLIIEAKSTYDLRKRARRQVYNYLRATNLEVGLLFHFGPDPKFYRTICRNTMNQSVQSEESV
jgi:GxxExxY protein